MPSVFILGLIVLIDRTLNLRLVHLELVKRCLKFEGRCQWQQLPSLPQAGTVTGARFPTGLGCVRRALARDRLAGLRSYMVSSNSSAVQGLCPQRRASGPGDGRTNISAEKRCPWSFL